MPEYLAPGVYVEEIPSGNRPIQAASTSTAGMVGMTARGPVNRPTLVTSLGEFEHLFGGKLDPVLFKDKDQLPYAAEGFFANGGARLYVVRVIGQKPAVSSVQVAAKTPAIPAPTDRELAAASPKGGLTLLLTDKEAITAGTEMLLDDGAVTEVAKVKADTGPAHLALDAGLSNDYDAGASLTLHTVTPLSGKLTSPAASGASQLEVDDVNGVVNGGKLLLRDPASAAPTEIVTVDSFDLAAKKLTLADALVHAHPIGSTLASADAGTAAKLVEPARTSGAPVFLSLDATPQIAAGAVVLWQGTKELSVVTGFAVETSLDKALAHAHAVGIRVATVKGHMTVHARWPGSWGDELRVQVSESANPLGSTTTRSVLPANDVTVDLASTIGIYPGSVLVFGGTHRAEVAAVGTDGHTVTLQAPIGSELPTNTAVTTQEFVLVVERMENGRAAETERFDRLSVGRKHPRYAPAMVGSWTDGKPSESGQSELVRISDDVPDDVKRQPFVGATQPLTGGNDDVSKVDAAAYKGTESPDPEARTGVQALANEPVVSIVAVPGQTDLTVQQALVQHCESMRYRFAVLDVPAGSNLEQARAHRQEFDTTRAALYWPDILVADPFGAPGDRRTIPPSGHVMGIYARTDLTRGVHKAPANEVIRGAVGLSRALTKGVQDILNPINLNCLRDFRSENRGLRVYGARVATSDPEWTYVNVRRLLLFIEQSLDNGLQWAVFEPNEKPLWDSVRQSVVGFLDTVWRSGALQGTKQEEAFFVNIGYGVTMMQADIDNGRLIVEIGVAPVKPAEFVIVRISQKTREAVA